MQRPTPRTRQPLTLVERRSDSTVMVALPPGIVTGGWLARGRSVADLGFWCRVRSERLSASAHEGMLLVASGGEWCPQDEHLPVVRIR
jgi:hypothetical protein